MDNPYCDLPWRFFWQQEDPSCDGGFLTLCASPVFFPGWIQGRPIFVDTVRILSPIDAGLIDYLRNVADSIITED